MTDTRARDALATALIRTGIFIDGGRDDPRVYASVLLRDEDLTPDDRRALAAAFLDAETLRAAMHDAYTYEDQGRDNAIPTLPFVDDVDAFWSPFATAILAALRETP